MSRRRYSRPRCLTSWRSATLTLCAANAVVLLLHASLQLICTGEHSALLPASKVCLPSVFQDAFNDRSDGDCCVRHRLGEASTLNCSRAVWQRIPRIWHQFWLDGGRPPPSDLLGRSPDWKVVQWTEASLRRLVDDFFPVCREPVGSNFSSMVASLKVFVLYKFGGMTFDLGHRVAGSLEPLLRHHGVVFLSPPHAMLFAPGHQFLLQLLLTQLSGQQLAVSTARGLRKALKDYESWHQPASDPSARLLMLSTASEFFSEVLNDRHGELPAAAHWKPMQHTGWTLMQLLYDRSTYKYLKGHCIRCSGEEMWQWL